MAFLSINRLEMIFLLNYMLLIICILLLLIFGVNFYNTKNIISFLSMFLTSTFYGSYKLLETTQNYIYFYFSIIFTALFTGALLQQFATSDSNLFYLYVLFFIVCTFTYTALIILAFHLKQNNLNQPHQGKKGEKGIQGQQGTMRI